MHDFSSFSIWKKVLEEGLVEDQWNWDWTARGALMGERAQREVTAKVLCKESGVWMGSTLSRAASQMSRSLSVPFDSIENRRDGDRVEQGEVLVEWKGSARGILAFERSFLNAASFCSGIASETRKIVDRVASLGLKKVPRITATRKTLPFYKDVSILSVFAGGGHCHRLNLASGVLIKENHIRAGGGIEEVVSSMRGVIPHGLKIEVEVQSLDELETALKTEVEAVLLDNFSPEEVSRAVKTVAASSRKPLIEVSGGVRLETVADFAIEGVDLISVGALTHSVRSLDLSLQVNWK